jgi:apolipoprotein N-acyltransferase
LSPGPYQHLYQARLRAVEEGLPVIRDANSGISAVIDPYGRLNGSITLGKVGTLDADLPVAIDPPLYATTRDIGVYIELIMMTLFTLWANLRRRRVNG